MVGRGGRPVGLRRGGGRGLVRDGRAGGAVVLKDVLGDDVCLGFLEGKGTV